MPETFADAYLRLILNLRILLDNPTQSATVDWLRLLGFALLSGVAVRGLVQAALARRLRERCPPWNDPRLSRLLERANARLQLQRLPELLQAPADWPGACAQGVWRPAVLLSRSLARRLSDRELLAVLTHELVHVARRDALRYWLRELLWACLPFLVIQGLGVYFAFSPAKGRLAWWGTLALLLGFRALPGPGDRFRERACDDRTVAATGDPLSLASALLETNRLAAGVPPWRPAAPGLLSGGSGLERRVRRLAAGRETKQTAGAARLGRGTAAAAATILLLLTAQFHLSPAGRELISAVWAAPCASVLLIE